MLNHETAAPHPHIGDRQKQEARDEIREDKAMKESVDFEPKVSNLMGNVMMSLAHGCSVVVI